MDLTIAIIARDEQRHIIGCLASVRGLTQEVLVLLDSRSRDKTGELARIAGARVVCEPWRGFPAQRNRALQLATTPWLLFLDADERVSSTLAQELRNLPDESTLAGYWIPRHNRFFGQTLRGGGWYPDHQLRLLRRSAAHYDEQRLVHEYAALDGEAGWLQGHLIHHNIEGLDELWAKQSAYALAEARTLYLSGRQVRWRNFLGAPAREFLLRYVKLGGWRDGPLGLLLCATLAWHEVVKFAFLYTLRGR